MSTQSRLIGNQKALNSCVGMTDLSLRVGYMEQGRRISKTKCNYLCNEKETKNVENGSRILSWLVW